MEENSYAQKLLAEVFGTGFLVFIGVGSVPATLLLNAARQGERDVQRAFFAGAMDASPDRQGRVAIPQGLRDFAGLERDVVVVGLYDHIEIWDAAAWRRTKQVGEQRLAGGNGAPAPTS